MIPFALGQRNSNNRGGHAALAASAPTKNVAPVASDYPKVPTAPSSVRFSWETPHLAKKLSGWPMVTGQTGAREIRVPLKPERPAGSCAWSIVANYPLVIESPSVCSDGTFVYSAGGLESTSSRQTRLTDTILCWTVGRRWQTCQPLSVMLAQFMPPIQTRSMSSGASPTSSTAPSRTSSKSTMSRPAPGPPVPPCLRAVFPCHCLLQSQRKNLRRRRNRRHVLRNQHNLGV